MSEDNESSPRQGNTNSIPNLSTEQIFPKTYQIPYQQVPSQQPNEMDNQQYQQIPMPMQAQEDIESYNYQPSKNQNMYANQIPSNPNQSTSGLRLLKPKQENKKVVAVIVSFCSGVTYDNLFTSVEQKSLEGTQVLVYSCDSSYLKCLLSAIRNEPMDEDCKRLMENIKEVDADCVVFNWQCSSGYSNKNFQEGSDYLFDFLRTILDKGFMAMFSDFSLKALIRQWNQKLMGPNPFRQISQTSNPVKLNFKAGQLKECPSAQLQLVGQMAEGGTCNIGVLGGTIVYTVDHQKAKSSDQYTLKILTVASNCEVKQDNLRCKIGDSIGAAGHVLLTYKNGGHLLTSMGHWVELMKIDTSEKKLFEIAERQYGAQRAQQMKMEYASLGQQQQRSWVSKNAVDFVQNQAPCSNMTKKAYFKS